MSYSKQKLYRITNRIYKELRDNSNDIILQKMRGNITGLYDSGTDEITLDYRMDILPTLIHEYLHKWYIDKSETWVLQEERKIVSALSIRQARNIIYAFAVAIS